MKQVIKSDEFNEFFSSLNQRDRNKVARHIVYLSEYNSGEIKHLRDQIYELKVHCGQSSYRILFIYDRGNIIVLLCGFAKKTQKTPHQILEQAIKIKNEYYGIQ